MSNRAAKLTIDIERDVASLDRLAREMELLLTRLPEQPTFVEVRAAGSILHDFYTATEKTFRWIAQALDGDVPKGGGWRTKLLNRMTSEIPGVRPAVITPEMERTLEQYLRMRNLFRAIYGFELHWELIAPLARRLPSVHKELVGRLSAFTQFLSTVPD